MKSIVAILIFVLCSCGENIVVNMKINVGEKMGILRIFQCKQYLLI